MCLPPSQPSYRGRTCAGRLSRLDGWFSATETRLLSRQDGDFRDAPVIDVGLGDTPVTTQELARVVRRVHPALRVIGVDIDPRRIARARECAPELDLRQGGFALPLRPGEARGRLVRAMNVLRGYPPAAHADALQRMGDALVPGGLLIEGRSCRSGHVVSALFLRRKTARRCGLEREALWLSTDFARGFAPNLLRDHLPADLHRRADGGRAMEPFFACWQRAFQSARQLGARDPRTLFVESVRSLARDLDGVCTDARLLHAGQLLWRPPAGVPGGAVCGSEPTVDHPRDLPMRGSPLKETSKASLG